ncbi:hypothetical protein DPMN_157707 [Dreissena polymorpha]|uniref:Uncharacterized protein n=1 Tax=Dreissena polymorpha TaxID=45954 RepID=A0A9D4IQ90_DREPO|nr:hypothetical protein DPMN_157707 [Dreissena polymorpha]
MYKDVQTKDIAHRMYQTTPPCKCLLEFSMQARRDAIAKYLLTLGMDWTVKVGNLVLLPPPSPFSIPPTSVSISRFIKSSLAGIRTCMNPECALTVLPN